MLPSFGFTGGRGAGASRIQNRKLEMSGGHIAQPDITLLLDLEGVIQSATLSSVISVEAIDAWHGRPWVDTVREIGSGKVKRMVEDARANGVSAFRQLTQCFPSGLEIPMEFTTVRLGGSEGLMAIGRSLQAVAELQSRLIAAQQSMEQDYWKLREVETRYRLLFDVSNEAVLMARTDNLRIIDANPAAIRLLGLGRGREFLPELAAPERDPFQTMLLRVREQGRAPGIVVHLGPERKPWTVRASLVTAEPVSMFLLQVLPMGTLLAEANSGAASGGNGQISLEDLIERLPDGFVVIDEEGVVRRANQGFLDLVQVGAEGGVLGARIGRWLARPGADQAVLLGNLHRHGMVRRFATTLQGELGAEAEVEISASRGGDPRQPFIGVMIRDVGRRTSTADNVVGLRSALSFITDQTGKTALPKLVRDTVGIVERHCIEAALELAEGNRTAAAELLGLSRQSLYEKLSRYDLEGNPRNGAGSKISLAQSN